MHSSPIRTTCPAYLILLDLMQEVWIFMHVCTYMYIIEHAVILHISSLH
jgi:hypothetical protein